MLDYSQIKPKKIIIFNDAPHECLDSWIKKKDRQKPTNQTKMRNLITGSVVEHTFRQSDKVEEAELSKRSIVFIYEAKGEYWFHSEGDKGDRFVLSADIVTPILDYMRQQDTIEAKIFNNEIIALVVPVKMDFKVTEAPPVIKGATASGSGKLVTIETGAQVNVPMFIETGAIIRVNTETGEYVERVEKA